MVVSLSYIQAESCRRGAVRRWKVYALFILALFSVKGYGQKGNDYEELPVTLHVPKIGTAEIAVLIRNEEAYLAAKDLFDFLKIKNTASKSGDTLEGFFMDPQASYLIDNAHHQIIFKGKTIALSPSELIETETHLYLKSSLFGQVFGLECRFNFRDLSVNLQTELELPAIREWQQELMRRNLDQLKGEKKADTTLKRKFSVLHLGAADWSVTTTQETNRGNTTRANLIMGAIVAGGEATANLTYYSAQPFSARQQSYRWRYVNNAHTFLRQVSAGRIIVPSVSTILGPLNGIQLTNTPASFRRSFGSYRYTGTTEPEWMVELYVNGILVRYVRADASGFYSFDIPLVYGASAIRLKFYGPWGEESSREETISIPFNFLPARQFEYTLSSGLVDDGKNSRFSRAEAGYGIHRRLTLAAGMEYLSSVMDGKPMPFVKASVRLGPSLVLNGEHIGGVGSKTTLHYRLPSNFQLDAGYNKFEKEQSAIWYNYLEERQVSVSMPLKLKKFHGFSRLSYHQYFLPKSRYSHAELLLSALVAGVSSNIKTYAQFTSFGSPTIYSSLSLSFRLPYDIRLTTQVQYHYNQKHLGMVKAEAEKRISNRGFLNVSYEANPLLRTGAFTLGVRYQFSMAQVLFSARRGNGTTTTTQSARGSLLYEGRSHYLGLSSQGTVGKGGLVVLSFLDLNGNGRREAGEPKAPGLNLRINGGRVERDEQDGTLRILGLQAYTDYFLELDKGSFDNIAWQIKNPIIKVTVEPNQMTLVEVPVSVVGEASGMVYLQKGGEQKGLSRVIINFYDSSSKRVGQTLSEGDGYFSYLGLEPGAYTARLDTIQLRTLQLNSSPQSLAFTIARSEEGVIADGFEFVLRPLFERQDQRLQTTESRPPVAKPSDTTKVPSPPKKQNLQGTPMQKKPQNGKPQGREAVNPSTSQRSKDSLNGKSGLVKIPDNARKVDTLTYRSPAPKRQLQPLIRKNQKKVPVRKEQPSPSRKKLVSAQQLLERKQGQVTQQLNRLLKEQQELIEKQRDLIEEIRQLKLRLLQKQNGKVPGR
jgi:hypothetical protein